MKIGLDLDGVFHHSHPLGHEAYCAALRHHGLPEVTVEQMRRHFTSNWPVMHAGLGVPEHLRAGWKDLYQRFYDEKPIGGVAPGAQEVIDYLLTKYGKRNVIMITNEFPERVQRFFVHHGLRGIEDRVRQAHSGKAQAFEEEGLTYYVGDSVSDGEACVAAKNKPHFVGVADDELCYNLPAMLRDLAEVYPNHPITIVRSLKEVRTVL